MTKQLLKQLETVRARNNALWMRLVGLGLECDELKEEFKKTIKEIVKNDGKIQKIMKDL